MWRSCMQCTKCVVVGDGYVGRFLESVCRSVCQSVSLSVCLSLCIVSSNTWLTGKTALVGVFSNKEYKETYVPTIFDNKIVGIQYKKTWINLGKWVLLCGLPCVVSTCCHGLPCVVSTCCHVLCLSVCCHVLCLSVCCHVLCLCVAMCCGYVLPCVVSACPYVCSTPLLFRRVRHSWPGRVRQAPPDGVHRHRCVYCVLLDGGQGLAREHPQQVDPRGEGGCVLNPLCIRSENVEECREFTFHPQLIYLNS